MATADANGLREARRSRATHAKKPERSSHGCSGKGTFARSPDRAGEGSDVHPLDERSSPLPHERNADDAFEFPERRFRLRDLDRLHAESLRGLQVAADVVEEHGRFGSG